MTDIIQSLNLFDSSSVNQATALSYTLFGKDATHLYEAVKQHSVYRQAIDALLENVYMHPLVYCKNKKYAKEKLTPRWAFSVCSEIIESFLAVGYAIYCVHNKRVVVGVPTLFNLKCKAGNWSIEAKSTTKEYGLQNKRWQLLMWQEPTRYGHNEVRFNSAAQKAERDTKIYNQLHKNHRQKDFFNSQPSVFTTIDKNLKNVNGSNKQWFQAATAPTAAAARSTSVDANFKYLVHQRAESIKALKNATGLFREKSGLTKLAGEEEALEDEDSKQHVEHVVTDGREIAPARALLSLTDGHQVLLDAENKIYFHLGVPPQIKGRNINAERSGINPRLNEIALAQFFNLLQRLRTRVSSIFECEELSLVGSVLVFQPCLSPYELDKLQPFIKTSLLPDLFAAAYHVPSTLFDPEKLAPLPQQPSKPGAPVSSAADNFKRKRADDDVAETKPKNPLDDQNSTEEQAKKQKRASEKAGVR